MTPEDIAKLPTPETNIVHSAWHYDTDMGFHRAISTCRSLEQRLAAAVMTLEKLDFLDGYDGCYLCKDARLFLSETLRAIKECK